MNRYSIVFGDIPLGQPPNQGFDHTIELEDGVKAVITTPYRHPKAYRDEIERAIHELLALGHIRPVLSELNQFQKTGRFDWFAGKTGSNRLFESKMAGSVLNWPVSALNRPVPY